MSKNYKLTTYIMTLLVVLLSLFGFWKETSPSTEVGEVRYLVSLALLSAFTITRWLKIKLEK